MAKVNGDPMAVANAGKGGMYNGQCADANGPRTITPVKDQSGLDRAYYGSKDNGTNEGKKESY